VNGLRLGLINLGGWTLLTLRSLRELIRPPVEVRRTIYELDQIGVRSLGIVLLTAMFTGMVLALQSAHGLAAFGAKLYVGEIVSLSLVREMGPVLTALLIAGRVGAGITAELGTMAVTEQVDAIRVLGASPVRKLVLPKIAATMIMLPLLTLLADALGILGGMFVSMYEFDMGVVFYWTRVFNAVSVDDLMSGLGKSAFFGLFISTIGCYYGLNARGGADGVGRATTRTVVVASITILVSDFFLTKLFMLL
jgi:phospholipid/cholesterol/gamma-HCH transport system permease protein